MSGAVRQFVKECRVVPWHTRERVPRRKIDQVVAVWRGGVAFGSGIAKTDLFYAILGRVGGNGEALPTADFISLRAHT